MKTKTLLFFSLLLSANFMYAQGGRLDSTFGKNGFAKVNPENSNSNSHALCHATVITKAGNIIMAGTGYDATTGKIYSTLVQLKPDGSVDKNFGENGIVNYDPVPNANYPSGITSIVMQPNGKFLIASGDHIYNNENDSLSTDELIITRFKANGTVDGSFGAGGSISVQHISKGLDTKPGLALQANGKILLCATSDRYDGRYAITVWRFYGNGLPDNTFNGTGTVDLSNSFTIWSMKANKIATQDSNIFISGTAVLNGGNYPGFVVIKLDNTGTPVPEFGTSAFAVKSFGATNTSECHDMVIQQNGDIILAGTNYLDITLPTGTFISFTKDGILNKKFNKTGILLLSESSKTNPNALAIQADGKLITAGVQDDFSANLHGMVMRITSKGVIDKSFGKNGTVTADKKIVFGYTAAAIDKNNNIIAAGLSNLTTTYAFVAARYLGTQGADMDAVTCGKMDLATTMSYTRPSVYPNPVQSNATLTYTLDRNEMVSVLLYDINGRLVQTINSNNLMDAGIHTQSIHFDQSVLPGNYILVIKTADKKANIKIIKQ